KPFSADDTWLDTAWDNRALPHPKRTAYSYEYAVLFYFAVPAAMNDFHYGKAHIEAIIWHK
ncbi:MAG: hypothetical protein PHD32_00005, partial [Eubacteriales bacterium]|nr:hypothetical protein [Eubacteriales bacterium]